MKKRGILNAQLAGFLAGLGHKDIFLLCDAGMPIPKNVPIADLAVTAGVPDFKQVFDAVLDEIVVEKYTMAQDVKETNKELLRYMQSRMQDAESEFIPHTDLKKMSADVKFAVRTGECSYYPNVILQAGVAF